ncbi:MAG: metallopeptidase family protein [Terriglobales bacterium]
MDEDLVSHRLGSGCMGNAQWQVREVECDDSKFARMPETAKIESFEEIVEWAYGTLPAEIREQTDFPGIQISEEPPEEILKAKNWPRGTEMLGCYSGVFRTKQQHTLVKMAPDLIFVFRGPILRCSRGDLRAEVKRVVWHEVAHWLGYESEEQVRDLGL